jgi:carbon storage regulator
MLILGRRPGETVLIDGGIRIVVVSCDRRGVRLGFEAPASVGIARGEIAEQSPDGSRSVRRNGHAAPQANAEPEASDSVDAAADPIPAAIPSLPPPPARRPAAGKARNDGE